MSRVRIASSASKFFTLSLFIKFILLIFTSIAGLRPLVCFSAFATARTSSRQMQRRRTKSSRRWMQRTGCPGREKECKKQIFLKSPQFKTKFLNFVEYVIFSISLEISIFKIEILKKKVFFKNFSFAKERTSVPLLKKVEFHPIPSQPF